MMKRLLNYSLVVALAFGLTMAAHAARDGNGNGSGGVNGHDSWRPEDWRRGGGNGHDNHNILHTAPEVDSQLAAGGLALLGGAITVLRARRRK